MQNKSRKTDIPALFFLFKVNTLGEIHNCKIKTKL